MPVTSTCKNCRKRFPAPDGSVGRITECPHCGESVRIIADAAPVATKPTAAQRVERTVDTVYALAVALNIVAYLAPTAICAMSGNVFAAILYGTIGLVPLVVSIAVCGILRDLVLVFTEGSQALVEMNRRQAMQKVY